MKRHAFVTFVALAACGPQQTRPAPEETPIDAAAEPVVVVVVPPDAGPPPPPPEVPPLERPTSPDELRALLKAAKTDDERIIYTGLLAELEWTALCKAPTDGLCFTMVARAKKAPPTCDMHAADVKVTPRPFKPVGEVTKLIGVLRQDWGSGSALHEITDPNAQADDYIGNFHMAEAYGSAMVILGDHAFEAFLAVASPTGLDFDQEHGAIAKKSMKRFDAWYQELVQLGTEATAIYQTVTADPAMMAWAPAAVVSGYGRMAQLQLRLAANLLGLEIPTDIRKDPDLVEIFCDAVDVHAVSLETQAKAAADACKMVADAKGVSADRCGP